MMKKILVVLLLLLAACSPSESGPPPTATPPAVFISALNDFISAASKLNAATSQGVNYVNFRDYYAEAGGAFDRALSTWPDDFSPEAKTEFLGAAIGWDLTVHLWGAKVDGKSTLRNDPLQDDIIDYGGGKIWTVITATGVDTGDVGVNDENITILMTLASEQFEAGRDIILPLMP
jgi:hypothetical protein